MEQIAKYLIIIGSLMTVELTVTESKNEYNKKTEKRYQGPVFINICDIKDRRSKVHCYCDNIKPKAATKADCWIFSGGITENDPIWPSFSSQSRIEHLTFNVRSDEALTFIPAKAVVRLDNLKHITIQFGTISKIQPYAFTNSTTIRQIVLKSNKIIDLERHSFSQMMMLSNLSLDDNQISELKRDVFFNLPNLHVLHLSNNNLTLVHEGCFKHLNNLIELKLDYNYISVITKETLEGLQNLSKLNLRNNKLTMIGNLAFSELWGLKELYLDSNSIEYISERAFGGLTQLRKLTMSKNKLTSFYEDILEDIRSIIFLDLRDNLLETISYETVRPIVEGDKYSSSVVYLDGNPLKCDCRLTWIYTLRNETKNIPLRNALEKVTCITEQPPDVHLNDQETLKKDNEITVEESVNYDYYDKNDEDNEGDEEEARRVSAALKLVDVPVHNLPCPRELMQSMEESYGLPIQNEIRLKSYSRVSRITSSLVFVAALSLLLDLVPV